MNLIIAVFSTWLGFIKGTNRNEKNWHHQPTKFRGDCPS